LIDRKEPRLSVRRQCLLVGVSRSRLYYQRKPRQPLHGQHHGKVRSIAVEHPYYGYRKVALELQRQDILLSMKQVRLVRNVLHIKALHAKRNGGI